MPNIDESFNFPFREEDFLSDNPTRRAQFVRDLLSTFRKMYEEIAIGVNLSFRMTVLSSNDVANGNPLTNLPRIGASIVVVSALENDAPSAIFSVLKTDYNTAATVSTLDTINGTGAGVWNGVALSMPTTTTTTNLVHNAASTVTGQFEVTILGSQRGR